MFILFEYTFLLRNVVGLDIMQLALLQLTSKFINMLVMFLPLKVFLLISTPIHMGALLNIEEGIGRNGYIILLLLLTTFLYLINILLHLQYGRLLNKQEEKLLQDKYTYNGKKFFIDDILELYRPCYLAISGFLMIAMSLFVFFFLSIQFAFVFLFTFYFYLVFVEYFVFTNNKFKLLSRLNLNSNQLLTILSSLLYLVLFFSIFIIFNYEQIHVSSAILILLLSRVANTSIKSFIINQHKLIN